MSTSAEEFRVMAVECYRSDTPVRMAAEAQDCAALFERTFFMMPSAVYPEQGMVARGGVMFRRCKVVVACGDHGVVQYGLEAWDKLTLPTCELWQTVTCMEDVGCVIVTAQAYRQDREEVRIRV